MRGYLVPLLLAAAAVAVTAVRLHLALTALRHAERTAHRPARVDAQALACLTGHLGDLAVFGLHQRGHVVLTRTGQLTVTRPDTPVPLDQCAVRTVGPARTRDLSLVVADFRHQQVQRDLEKRLRAQGLLQDPALRTAAVRAAAIARTTAVLAVAVVWYCAGRTVQHGGARTVPLLSLALALGCAVLVIARSRVPERRTTTVLGVQTVDRARAGARREDHTLAVALDGLGALPVTHPIAVALAASRTEQAALAKARDARRAASTSGSTTELSGSGGVGLGGACGGGSGCGSGCGGCGGCGGGL
ncbi:TIGR04222 domain-containing membrane protein [Kitasatospora purpeofusca]|uniref:TIGR04222 domain-containing membrane protein n=1 Tax=Kitasatospora purpeofusca TaxID=67352 RepID=UPI0038220145